MKNQKNSFYVAVEREKILFFPIHHILETFFKLNILVVVFFINLKFLLLCFSDVFELSPFFGVTYIDSRLLLVPENLAVPQNLIILSVFGVHNYFVIDIEILFVVFGLLKGELGLSFEIVHCDFDCDDGQKQSSNDNEGDLVEGHEHQNTQRHIGSHVAENPVGSHFLWVADNFVLQEDQHAVDEDSRREQVHWTEVGKGK